MNLRKITSFVAVALMATVASTAQANTVKWSMKGDSLTLDPHEQNEGPTTMVSRQIYEALVSRGLDMSISWRQAGQSRTRQHGSSLCARVSRSMMARR